MVVRTAPARAARRLSFANLKSMVLLGYFQDSLRVRLFKQFADGVEHCYGAVTAWVGVGFACIVASPCRSSGGSNA